MIDLSDPTYLDKQSPVITKRDSSDPVTAYLELALRIYLRIKNEGQTIHNPQIDDETDRLYDHPAGGSSNPQSLKSQ